MLTTYRYGVQPLVRPVDKACQSSIQGYSPQDLDCSKQEAFVLTRQKIFRKTKLENSYLQTLAAAYLPGHV